MAKQIAASTEKVANLAQKYFIHDIAKSGFGTGTNDLYDAARPSYPAPALRIIHDKLRSTSPHPFKIIEPGSGTGIFSRLLLKAPDSTYPTFDIDTLVCVEPSQGMRDAWYRSLEKAGLGSSLREKTGEGSIKLGVVNGGFDELSAVQQYGITQVENGRGGVDGVIIAQAWHWCPDYEKALREITSYLPSGALFILIWNLESNCPTWQGDLRNTYQPYDLGTPQYYKGLWRSMFDTNAYKELFHKQEEHKISWSMGITDQMLIERLLSKSYLTEKYLDGEERSEFIEKIRKIINAAPRDWVVEEKGIFKYQYDTDIIICKKK
ncbi:hypothetical protein L204_103737 [Cryptococcus depauperatus]|nr:hypothetical protein L204_02053 [Cryptococcus depauperatus CBS 7855]